MKDLILHFRDNTLDEPFFMAAGTNKLIVRSIDLGFHLNDPDDDEDTPLYLLIQLLYPSDKGSYGSGSLRGFKTFQASRRATRSSMDLTGPDPESVFNIQQESYMHMQGDNTLYGSDSDFIDDNSDAQDTEDDGSTDEHASGLARRGRDRQLDKADDWILSFYFLLSEGDSLAMKNNDGKTALDCIDGLRAWWRKACLKAYRRIITALRNFNMSAPVNSELLTKLMAHRLCQREAGLFSSP